MAASLVYRPEQYEQSYYLGLFKAADVQGRGNIGGADAVKFFGRSKLPVEVLKNIWTVADTPSTSSLDLKKFAVAVRLIQLTQNGQKGKGQNLETPPGVVLKPVFFEGISGVSLQMPQPPDQGMPAPQPTPQGTRPPVMPMPTPGGMPPPQPTPQQPNREMAPAQPVPTPMTPSRALVGMDPYTMSPQERQRYENLFPNYAKTEADGSQFVYGSEAVPLFMKSGVDPNKLREIWSMVDRNPVDNRLDKLEFALAMHLIVCVSKKNLPLPSGALPPSLQALKSAPSGAAAAPAAAAPAPQPATGLPPPAATATMNISDAFEGMSAIGSVTDYSQAPEPEAPAAPALPAYVPDVSAVPPPAVVPEPPTPQPQPTYVPPAPLSPKPAAPESIPAPVPPAPVATYEASDSNSDELAQLKSALQKLQAENVSLKAQLGTVTEEEKHVQQEVAQTKSEIAALTADLEATRQEVLNAKSRLFEAKAELSALKEKKGVLTGQISEGKETVEAIESAREALQGTSLAETSAPPAPTPAPQPSADLFGMGYSNPLPAAANPPMSAQDGVPPASEMQGQQELSIPEPSADNQYGNYMAPMPGDYAAPAPVPPQQDAPAPVPPQPAVYDAPAPVPPQPAAGGYGAPAPVPPQPAVYDAPAPVPPQPAAGGYGAPAPVPPQPAVYDAPVPPQPAAGGYGAPAPVPPQPAVYDAPAPVPPQPAAGGYGAPAPVPPQPAAGGYGAPATMAPVQEGYPAQQPTPLQHRQAAAPGHVRNSSGFDAEYLMGGSAQAIPQDPSRDNDNFSQAARSIASNGDYGYDDQAFEAVENMKKKAKKADAAARDAEAAHRKLAAEAAELRSDADRAQANARSLAAQAAPDEKKKRFGGSNKKKQKKQQEEASQAAKDAALIKNHFMAIQSQALEAQTVAAQTRAEADRLRDVAEAAELDMATSASKKQTQPAPVPAPAPVAPQQQAPAGYPNGYGGMAPPPQQQPYGMPNGGQQMMPQYGGYNNYGDAYGQPQQPQHPPQQQAYGGQQQMAYGAYGQAPPAQPVGAPGGYASPF